MRAWHRALQQQPKKGLAHMYAILLLQQVLCCTGAEPTAIHTCQAAAAAETTYIPTMKLLLQTSLRRSLTFKLLQLLCSGLNVTINVLMPLLDVLPNTRCTGGICCLLFQG
jgi:hypothetical protein